MITSVAIIALLASCAISSLLIMLLHPVLLRYALARPNARSSHTIPTPQGGGIAVIAATIVIAAICIWHFDIELGGLLKIFAATVSLAILGAFDDLRPIPVLPRLILQVMAVGIVLSTLPDNFRIVPIIPLWAERATLLLGGLWFVNLVNFMDGLDWITAAEIIPVAATLTVFGMLGELPDAPTIIALALAGAMLGFAPYNRPVARLFLGDVGSLPIGLLTGWCLLQLAGNGHLVAALLLPLYYLADATITLLRRLGKGEPVWLAHRSHFYQRATTNGFSVMQVVTEVFFLNILLAGLAAASIWLKSTYADVIALALGVGAVALVLGHFSRPRKVLP